MNTFAIRDAEASSTTNAPSPDARRWIALAMEMQYGADARATDFARTLWRRSVASSDIPDQRRRRRPNG
jgi:hypothetical protein